MTLPTTERNWWDNEALGGDPRYATLAWGGDGTADQIMPTIGLILENLTLIQSRLENTSPRVLEVGCGPGRILHRFARLFPFDECVGLDVSPQMLALGNRDRPGNVKVVVGDGRLIPVEEIGMFDLIYSVEVFQHLDHDTKKAYLTEIGRALTDNGLAVIQYVEGEDPDVIMHHPIPAKQMAALVKSAGLTVTRIIVHNHIHDDWRWMVVRK